MGIFDRFKTVVKSNINDLISKAEDPEKMLNQLVFDMNSQLVEAKKQVAASIADEKRLERQLIENKAKADDWERKAMLAVKAGKDDLAKEALVRKQEFDNYTKGFEQEWEKQKQAVEQLKSTLRQLQLKIEEATRKKNLLVARAKRAEAQKKIQSTLGQLSDNSAFSSFDRMAAKVDQVEAEADAMGELAEATSGTDPTLEKQFKELESSSGGGADAMLEELKAKMAKLEDKTSSSQQP
jgi:phage shock protein A